MRWLKSQEQQEFELDTPEKVDEEISWDNIGKHIKEVRAFFSYSTVQKDFKMKDTSQYEKEPALNFLVDDILDANYNEQEFYNSVLKQNYPDCYERISPSEDTALSEKLINKCNWGEESSAYTKSETYLGPNDIYYRILKSPSGDKYTTFQVELEGQEYVFSKSYFIDDGEQDLLDRIEGEFNVVIVFDDGSSIKLDSTQCYYHWQLEIENVKGRSDSVAKQARKLFKSLEGKLELEEKIDKLVRK